MTQKEKQAVVDTCIRGLKNGLERKPSSVIRPDFMEWITDRYISMFPNDGVEICLMIKDELLALGLINTDQKQKGRDYDR